MKDKQKLVQQFSKELLEELRIKATAENLLPLDGFAIILCMLGMHAGLSVDTDGDEEFAWVMCVTNNPAKELFKEAFKAGQKVRKLELEKNGRRMH